MRDEERPFAALAHVVAAIPLWGIVGDTIIWLYFKERSRDVVFHAQQAIIFQVTLLAVTLVGILVKIFKGIAGLIDPNLASKVHSMNMFFIYSCVIVYVAICLYGALMTWSGRDFLYPLIGKRMAAGYRRHVEP